MSYQTILLVIQGLPRQHETVDRFSTIIGAPFKSRPRCPDVIVGAFNEFWESTYADVNEPESGWPALIKAALQASQQGDGSSLTNQGHEALGPADKDSCSDQSRTQQMIDEVPKEIPSRGKLAKAAGIAVVEHSVRSNPRGPATLCKSPSTPRKERQIHVSTPPRRQRTTLSPKTLHTSSPESRSPLTDLRKRNALPASFYASPTPKVSNKENVSPKPLPDMFASVLGKRKMEQTAEDSTGYVKRKISSSRSLKTARSSGNRAVIANDGPTEAVGNDVFDTPSKKRKSEVFAGVMVPTVKEIMLRRRHSAPLKEEAGSQPSGCSAFTSPTTLRKSRSTARMNLVDHRSGDDPEASPRKKIRTIRSGEPTAPIIDFLAVRSGKAVRLRLHDEFEVDGTDLWRIDDSIMVADPSVTTAQLPSDDDPMKLGRYTPRVLMSPVLSARRLNEKRWDDADTGSDDSVEPNSPTKDVIERRKKMGWPTAPRAADGERGILIS